MTQTMGKQENKTTVGNDKRQVDKNLSNGLKKLMRES